MFVLVFQLPGPATCLKLAWRFTAVEAQVTAPEEAPAEESAARPETVRIGPRVRNARPSLVVAIIPPSRRQPALDAGTTRAPPSA
jgi:hypothetical protein